MNKHQRRAFVVRWLLTHGGRTEEDLLEDKEGQYVLMKDYARLQNTDVKVYIPN